MPSCRPVPNVANGTRFHEPDHERECQDGWCGQRERVDREKTDFVAHNRRVGQKGYRCSGRQQEDAEEQEVERKLPARSELAVVVDKSGHDS